MKIGGFLNASYIRIDNPSAKTTESSASKKTETTETLTTSQKALLTNYKRQIALLRPMSELISLLVEVLS